MFAVRGLRTTLTYVCHQCDVLVYLNIPATEAITTITHFSERVYTLYAFSGAVVVVWSLACLTESTRSLLTQDKYL